MKKKCELWYVEASIKNWMEDQRIRVLTMQYLPRMLYSLLRTGFACVALLFLELPHNVAILEEPGIIENKLSL